MFEVVKKLSRQPIELENMQRRIAAQEQVTTRNRSHGIDVDLTDGIGPNDRWFAARRHRPCKERLRRGVEGFGDSVQRHERRTSPTILDLRQEGLGEFDLRGEIDQGEGPRSAAFFDRPTECFPIFDF